MEIVKYIRVSTPEQNIDRQKDGLKAYIDICSGSIPFRDREQGEKLWRIASVGTIDCIEVQSIDRLGRDTLDILNTIKFFTSMQVNVISQKEGLSTLLPDGTENPTAKLLVGILGTLAEFELTRIKERQAEGIAKAKLRGVYKTNGNNRAIESVSQFLAKTKNAKCMREIGRGNSLRRSAKIAGISLGTAQKIKSLMESV
jgi:DNA invertase Pin-like site-specific DNA recombinase